MSDETNCAASPQLLNELSDHQQALLRQYPCPQLFAVVTWGCAATSWLARVLNSHPDIYCVHAANHLWHTLGGCERRDGVPYLRIVGSQGHAHKAAGCVHGVSRHFIPECRRTFGSKFNAVVVVREPIARIRSQQALFKQYEGIQAWNLDYVDGLMSRTSVILPADDYSSKLFVHAANMLNAILEERDVGKIYRSEDLTQNSEALGDFVKHVTREKVSASLNWNWLGFASEIRRINVHAEQYSPPPLNDWQIDVIRKVVDPHSWELYEGLGYRRPEFLA